MKSNILNVAICEDDEEFARRLSETISKIIPKANINVYKSGEALLSRELSAHIYLLDLKLPGIDGMETARRLRKAENTMSDCHSAIIFLTGFDNKMSEAFDVGAFHYLVKPIKTDKLRQVLTRAAETQLKRLENKGESITIKARGAYRRVYLKDIKYADCYRKKITLHIKIGEITFYCKMDDFEKELSNSFFRCHRGVIVNLDYVAKFDSKSITLDDGTEISMSRRKFPEFEAAFADYMKEVMLE